MFDELHNLKTEIQHLKDNQKEFTTHVIEFITIRLPNSNAISVESFQKKPKLASIQQLWWVVSNNNIIMYC